MASKRRPVFIAFPVNKYFKRKNGIHAIVYHAAAKAD
jgi:hypothetical protein